MLSNVSQGACIVPRLAKSCALPVVSPWGSVGVRCVERRCVYVCVAGRKREAGDAIVETHRCGGTRTQLDFLGRRHTQGTQQEQTHPAQKAAAETWRLALGGLVGNVGMGRV